MGGLPGPLPEWADFLAPYRTAYALGAVCTDSGFTAGIGGCAEQRLVGQLARRTRTYFYEFDDLTAPGLNRSVPGYQWGAGHAMELACMWPSFNNGYSLYKLLTPSSASRPAGWSATGARSCEAAARRSRGRPDGRATARRSG